ncbi:unnamed protein product [Parnassius mnemosyne]|uniref:CFA20 domain-containing protein n=1 Tax=Parnassius mnemosyne TaxID=213953 RepID=A0AAV1KQE1_9NEOP
MFKNTYQSGLLTIFYSCGSNPLAIWDMKVQNGHVKRLTDNEVNSIVLEIVSTNVATTYITCPRRNQVLGIKLPFLVMIVKNLKRYFSFEITILDDKNMRRRFRISNFQSTTKIKPFCTTMPIGLSGGWNQIQFNLADFTKRAYGTQFIETLRVQVHANARLRRIYFCERLYTEEELPQDYKLYLPLERKQRKVKESKKLEKPADVVSRATAPPPPPTPPVEVEPLITSPKEQISQNVSVHTIPPVVTDITDEKPPSTKEELLEMNEEDVADATRIEEAKEEFVEDNMAKPEEESRNEDDLGNI